jgi:transcriptional regulator with XRE-family HTH domain
MTFSNNCELMRGTTANGKLVHAARVSRGLTQEQLASLAGVDAKTIRKAEQGKRLDARTLARLALALEMDLEQLVRGAPTDMGQAARRRTAEKWVRAWDAQDLAGVMACYHADLPDNAPGTGRYRAGR